MPSIIHLTNKFKLLFFFFRWFDNDLTPRSTSKSIDWSRVLPFVVLHLACLGPIWVGCSGIAILLAAIFYAIRIFAIGAFYHRYFSHKTFQTNRFWQCIFAILGLTAIQRGPLWWAAHHRDHHLYSDTEQDAHSPHQGGFLWSHMGWFLTKKHFHYNPERIKDFLRFPELRWLDRFDVIVPIACAIGIYFLGEYLQSAHPELHTNGLQLFFWVFCISSICVLHATFTINSLNHLLGRQKFETKDQSRNSFLLAFLTFGEGWHNNHHFYPATARQGFLWWEYDFTYYLLKLLEKLKIVRNLRQPPTSLLSSSKCITYSKTESISKTFKNEAQFD